MPAAAKLSTRPRYGSAADVAALTGLSLKTVRRRVKDGTLRGVTLGRRVLIDLDALDRPRTPEPSAMATTHTPAPAVADGDVDTSTGRLRPLTDEQRRARSAELARALDDIAGMTDETDTDEVWRDVLRGIDEGRPHRPLFEGSY